MTPTEHDVPAVSCHDWDCVRSEECPHFLRDLSEVHHVASGRSGGGCDLWNGTEDAE